MKRRRIPAISAAIVWAALSWALAGGAAPYEVPQAGGWPASRLVLFGARWCAPCTAELRDAPLLAVEARRHGIALVLAWVDRPVAPLAGEAAIERMAPALALDRVQAVAGIGFGLPLAVMTDSGGRVCAMRRARVDLRAVAAMIAQCRPAG